MNVGVGCLMGLVTDLCGTPYVGIFHQCRALVQAGRSLATRRHGVRRCHCRHILPRCPARVTTRFLVSEKNIGTERDSYLVNHKIKAAVLEFLDIEKAVKIV